MRKIFKNGPSPSVEACEALTGVPPIDIYCESIAVQFAIKIRQNDDLVRDTHLKSICKSRSRAISLSRIKFEEIQSTFEQGNHSRVY